MAAASAGNEEAVGLGPGPAHGELVQHLDLGRLAAGQELDVDTAEREIFVGGDILPEEAEILGSEGLAVGPFVPLAQVEREDPAVLDLVTGQDVGDEVQVAIEADEVGVAVDVEEPRFALAADQHPQLAAGLADVDAFDHARLIGRAGQRRRRDHAQYGRRDKPMRPRPDHACFLPFCASHQPAKGGLHGRAMPSNWSDHAHDLQIAPFVIKITDDPRRMADKGRAEG